MCDCGMLTGKKDIAGVLRGRNDSGDRVPRQWSI